MLCTIGIIRFSHYFVVQDLIFEFNTYYIAKTNSLFLWQLSLKQFINASCFNDLHVQLTKKGELWAAEKTIKAKKKRNITTV